MWLLAQEGADPLKDYGELGLTGGLVAFAIFLLWRYVPRLIDTHLDFVTCAKKQSEQILQLHQDNVQRQTHHASATDRTNEALRHGCDLLDMAIRGTPKEHELRQHVLAIRNALTDRG